VLGLWVLLAGGRVTGGLLLGAPILELDVDFFEIGDTLDVRCSHVWGTDEVWKFDCEVEREGVSLVRATLNVLRIHPERGSGDEPDPQTQVQP
jgi:predicted hotdog family 3-hydroxylacyl-ACP dehydratase